MPYLCHYRCPSQAANDLLHSSLQPGHAHSFVFQLPQWNYQPVQLYEVVIPHLTQHLARVYWRLSQPHCQAVACLLHSASLLALTDWPFVFNWRFLSCSCCLATLNWLRPINRSLQSSICSRLPENILVLSLRSFCLLQSRICAIFWYCADEVFSSKLCIADLHFHSPSSCAPSSRDQARSHRGFGGFKLFHDNFFETFSKRLLPSFIRSLFHRVLFYCLRIGLKYSNLQYASCRTNCKYVRVCCWHLMTDFYSTVLKIR